MTQPKPARSFRISSADTGVLLVLLGAVFSGLRPLFARLLIDDRISAFVTALYCYTGSAIFFLPFAVKDLRRSGGKKCLALLAVISGVSVGIGSAAYFEALRRLSVATVTLIYFTYPAMVVLCLAIYRRRWPRTGAWFGILCVVLGIVFIVGNGIESAGGSLVDFSIAFIAPVSWTILRLALGGPLTQLTPFARIGFIISDGRRCAHCRRAASYPQTGYGYRRA